MQQKPLFLVLFLSLFSFSIFAQTLAITEKGDTVYLYDNGTWGFSEIDNFAVDETMSFLDINLDLDTLSEKFTFPPQAKKEVKSDFDFLRIKYDEETWNRIPPGTLNAEASFAFQGKKGDIYCMVIIEEVSIGLENIAKIALTSMEERLGIKVDVLATELRNVNGTDVIRGVYRVDNQGMKLTFDSYYYSSDQGTVQFTTWTGANVHKKYEADLLDLLNGLIIE